MLNDFLKNVCVLGAAGKMGRGIALLLLQEMARLQAELTGNMDSRDYHLLLIDSDPESLDPLKPYLRSNLTKYAEKNINALRKSFSLSPKLVSNEEMIDYFVTGAIDNVHFDTDAAKAVNADMVFEAIVEDVDIKSSLMKHLAANATKKIYFFSNTSSIPIHILNEKGDLRNRIVGFHFYNPPAIQKLVELVFPSLVDPDLVLLSHELAKRLNKISVVSKDVAGFIGNGYFIREILFACERVRELSRIHTIPEAIYIVNRITQDFLIRPMGIFQLIDYVGIDVCKRICQMMSAYLPGELFQDALIDQMIAEEVLGGQFPDGSQKNGFFEYEGAIRKGIYAPREHKYLALTEAWTKKIDKELGPYPEGHLTWKQLQREPQRLDKIKHYFHNLHGTDTQGTDLAKDFLVHSRESARNLVAQGIAQRIEDVDTVLEHGFFHLYGSEVPWLNINTLQRSK